MMLIFSALVVIAAMNMIVGRFRRARPTAKDAQTVATTVLLASAVGLLLSSATLYLTYRPYWYIFQRAILNGDSSQSEDLRDFLIAVQVPPGIGYNTDLSAMRFPFYFWTGVTLLGLVGLACIFLRHLRGHPPPRPSV